MLAAERYHIGWMDVEEWQRKETKTAALLAAYDGQPYWNGE
jgi:hypothetical protein